MEIRLLKYDDITSDLLQQFNHYQIIRRKYVKKENEWRIIPVYELREWNAEKRIWISTYLQQQVKRGGLVIAAYDYHTLTGFASLDGFLRGSYAKYANLTMLFVDDKWQRKGIGRLLFHEICIYAKKLGAEKLFISAISSFETIVFYHSLGCTDAVEVIPEYIDTEKDRYLEYLLQ